MKTKLHTLFWMIIFAAATFCLLPAIFAVIVFTQLVSDTAVAFVLWPMRLIFIASPWIALFLGMRGVLPGTEPVADPDRNTTISKPLTLAVLVISMVFTLGAWMAFLPPPARPNMSVTLLGYTNDPAGTRLAQITVTNLNPTTIYVYQPRIELQAPADPRSYENYFSGVNCPWHSLLAPGAADSFTIPPPTNPSPWRVSFYVYPDRGRSVKNAIKSAVRISCVSVGLWPRLANQLPINGAFRHPYNVEGDWIQRDQ